MQTFFFFFLLSSLFLQVRKTEKTEICDPMNQMAAGSGMKNNIALIPNVESGEAASVEEITQYSVVEEELAYVR